MISDQPNYLFNPYFNIPVPDLMNDLTYLRELNSAYQEPSQHYYNEYSNQNCREHYFTRELREIVDNIQEMDEYNYSNLASALDTFHSYLITLTHLKDLLMPNSDGIFSEKWFNNALEFQVKCEEIFLNYVKREYISSFLPLLPNQLEYTSNKLKMVPDMGEEEVEDFRNLFSLIALGFVGKLKLLSFYLSVSVFKEYDQNSNDFMKRQERRSQTDRKEPSYDSTTLDLYNSDTNQTTVSKEGFYCDDYQNLDLNQEFDIEGFEQASEMKPLHRNFNTHFDVQNQTLPKTLYQPFHHTQDVLGEFFPKNVPRAEQKFTQGRL